MLVVPTSVSSRLELKRYCQQISKNISNLDVEAVALALLVGVAATVDSAAFL
jgi:hypothetical protein